MTHFILEISRNDKDMIDFIDQHKECEFINDKNFGGEVLFLHVIVPIAAGIIPLFVQRFLDRSNISKDEKRVIVTKDGRYEFKNYSAEEVIKFLDKLTEKKDDDN